MLGVAEVADADLDGVADGAVHEVVDATFHALLPLAAHHVGGHLGGAGPCGQAASTQSRGLDGLLGAVRHLQLPGVVLQRVQKHVTDQLAQLRQRADAPFTFPFKSRYGP